ncbi:MAG: DUF3109 family protein [Myxococcales bacterium]|nr:DUF3109 family protein [Myxococcales bacterium]
MPGARKVRFELSRNFNQWLKAPDPGPPDIEVDRAFARWILGLMAREQIRRVGPVFVDAAVLKTRFACVPERCAPGPGRGRFRSCCADIDLLLTPAERKPLEKNIRQLSSELLRHEPRLTPNERGQVELFDATGEVLRRPGKRCVFSVIDRRARIRCRLHAFAKRSQLPLSALQPRSCRLFPLVLVNLGRAVLLTVVNRHNYRAWQALHPSRFPCLADPALPPLIRSMSATLDELFGPGFARELEKMQKDTP